MVLVVSTNSTGSPYDKWHYRKDQQRQRFIGLWMLSHPKGDFAAVCAASPETAPWVAYHYKLGRHCNVSSNDIIQKATSLEVRKLFIISDDPNISSTLAGIPQRILTSKDVRLYVESMLPRIRPNPTTELLEVVAAVTEQHICALAYHVVLNSFSTFSGAIANYRKDLQGIEYW